MPNYAAQLGAQSVSGEIITYPVQVVAADGATYALSIEVPGSALSGNISSFNSAIKDIVQAALLAEYGVEPGSGKKIVLMGGGV